MVKETITENCLEFEIPGSNPCERAEEEEMAPAKGNTYSAERSKVPFLYNFSIIQNFQKKAESKLTEANTTRLMVEPSLTSDKLNEQPVPSLLVAKEEQHIAQPDQKQTPANEQKLPQGVEEEKIAEGDVEAKKKKKKNKKSSFNFNFLF